MHINNKRSQSEKASDCVIPAIYFSGKINCGDSKKISGYGGERDRQAE